MFIQFLKKIPAYIVIFLGGSYFTLFYFLYRARTEFVPHISKLSGVREIDVRMIETFEWPLDILFPTVPIFAICLIYLFITVIVKLIRNRKR